MWGKVLLAPWLVWNHVIGVIVYLQHTGPDLRWHTHRSWTKYRGQVEGTMNLRAPALLNFFWHNIFLHVPHHVDPRIPFYHLPAASEALARAGVRAAVVRPLRLADYVASVRRCKLHDPDDGVWLGRDELRSLDRAARPG
jgi:omega-6 fatty acid desaturase (delta-12 desaturase)